MRSWAWRRPQPRTACTRRACAPDRLASFLIGKRSRLATPLRSPLPWLSPRHPHWPVSVCCLPRPDRAVSAVHFPRTLEITKEFRSLSRSDRSPLPLNFNCGCILSFQRDKQNNQMSAREIHQSCHIYKLKKEDFSSMLMTCMSVHRFGLNLL